MTATTLTGHVTDDLISTAAANGWRVMPGKTDDGDTILTAPRGFAVLRVHPDQGGGWWARLTDHNRAPAQQLTMDAAEVATWLTGATR